MNVDKYGEIVNGEETYKCLAKALKQKSAIIIGWTDEKMIHLDILLTYTAVKREGNMLQRGLRWSDLFVSVIGTGAFGFTTDGEKDASYIGEKLNLGVNETTEKLTELINGIIQELKK